MDTVEKEATGFLILAAIACAVFVAVTQTGCSFQVGFDYQGTTAKDNRTISPSLYPEGINQAREAKQRY